MPKLIEIALPIKEISAESVRDKSIHHGHISTLHLWWARRPLPLCRAVVFASLVPDPDSPDCPQAFREACQILLGPEANPGDPYKPYANIPYTPEIDTLPDTPRNRLLAFIGKFSDKYIQNESQGKKTEAKELLSPYSLIKCENKNNPSILAAARKLIFVAHNAHAAKTAQELLQEFDARYAAIQEAETTLYQTPDRHLPSPELVQKEENLQNAIAALLQKMPKVFDPFAGGGAIPLEAARLGCNSFGNDLNPVAHIIQRASLEFPQRFGKPITYTPQAYQNRYGEKALAAWRQKNPTSLHGANAHITLPNRLAHDVEYYARQMLQGAEEKIGRYYPPNAQGQKPIAYYWARVARCANPTCAAEVPLLKQFYLCNKPDKKIYLFPIIEGNKIRFEIREGEYKKEGWMTSRALTCPCCQAVTDVKKIKEQAVNGILKEKLLAVIEEGQKSKAYRLPSENEIEMANIPTDLIKPELIPSEPMQVIPDLVSGRGWGINHWGQLFSPRQLLALQTLMEELEALKNGALNEPTPYNQAVITMLAMWLDRIVARANSYCIWHTSAERVEHPFGRQALPMIFDYPELGIFCNESGAFNQLSCIISFINSEAQNTFHTHLMNVSSGDKTQFPEKSLDAVVTDPPYYDAIAYADLSDFFYVWLKRTLGDVFPLNFATPQTPKREECTALAHHHGGSKEKAKAHFENKLLEIFTAIERQTRGVIVVMFAHQTVEAWATLCRSILGANMNIAGSWSIESEQQKALKVGKDFLSSSVTVACLPAQRSGRGSFLKLKKILEEKIREEVDFLYGLGFRGADLLTACFGKAVSEIGRYSRVEKADGEEVDLFELLDLTRRLAYAGLLLNFETDEPTRFYIAWLQLYGFSPQKYDELLQFTRGGFEIDAKTLKEMGLIRDAPENSVKLADATELYGALYAENEEAQRIKIPAAAQGNSLIEAALLAVWLYRPEVTLRYKKTLNELIQTNGPESMAPFWRLLTALAELLPDKAPEKKIAGRLLSDQSVLLQKSKEQAQREKEGKQEEISISSQLPLGAQLELNIMELNK